MNSKMFSNHPMFINCDQVCRLCLSGTVELQQIFGQNDNHSVAEILKNLTSISIVEDDGMPQKICTLCVHQANSAHYFILKCKETDRMLKQNLYETRGSECGSPIGIIDFDVNDDCNSKDYGIETLKTVEGTEMEELYAIEEVQDEEGSREQDVKFNCDKYTETLDCDTKLQCHRKKEHPIQVNVIDLGEKSTVDDAKPKGKRTSTNKAMPFECVHCNKKFRRLHSFNKHIKIHNESNFICELCGKSFGSQSHLKRHLNETHEREPQSSSFTCTVCGKEMKRLNHFTVHMRTHRDTTDHPSTKPSMAFDEQNKATNKIKFPCTVCNKMCSSRSNFAVHMRRHSGQMTKFCSVCGKGYPRSTDLTIHMRKHTGERPFTCQVCSRSFARSDKLTIHMRVHTGEKPYRCQNCSRAFAQSNDLASHRKRNVCGAANTTKPVNN